MTLGQRLRHLRESQGLSLRELAEKSGVNHASIGNIETGERVDPRTSIMVKLARALGVSLQEMCEPGGE